jgi:ethanolamine permease
MLILTTFALLILILGVGAAGADTLKNSGAPLVDALITVYGKDSWLATFC